MILDLTPLLSGEVSKLPFAIEESLSDAVWDSDLTFPEPIRVSGTITNQAGYMQIALEASFVYDTACARCLAPIRKRCTLSMEKGVASENALENRESDDYITYSDRALMLDEAVADLLYLNIPYRHLCREDCGGLCPACGKNLNEGGCSCQTKAVDPRLAILAQLLMDKDE